MINQNPALQALLGKLQEIKNKKDPDRDAEIDHREADEALIYFINNAQITSAYNVIKKWYA